MEAEAEEGEEEAREEVMRGGGSIVRFIWRFAEVGRGVCNLESHTCSKKKNPDWAVVVIYYASPVATLRPFLQQRDFEYVTGWFCSIRACSW